MQFTTNQIEQICNIVKRYLEICEYNEKQTTSNDVVNSSLLRRLLSGKDALAYPPPYRFGFPAYELIESDEIQIQDFEVKENEIFIDGHGGYSWLDIEKKIICYNRLNLKFELIKKEILPDPACIDEDQDPKEYKYTAKFLKKIINIS